MIIDCSSPDWDRKVKRVHVDGREVIGIHYLDTDAGFVKTTLVFQDLGDMHIAAIMARRRIALPANERAPKVIRTTKLTGAGFERGDFPAAWEMDAIAFDAPLTRTIRGKVEVMPWNAA